MEGHNETPCIAISNKHECLFSKAQDRNVNQVLSGVGISGRGEDIRKGWRRVNVAEILCTHV
jgi:hypothetical protein